jgi:hypothetical protein
VTRHVQHFAAYRHLTVGFPGGHVPLRSTSGSDTRKHEQGGSQQHGGLVLCMIVSWFSAHGVVFSISNSQSVMLRLCSWPRSRQLLAASNPLFAGGVPAKKDRHCNRVVLCADRSVGFAAGSDGYQTLSTQLPGAPESFFDLTTGQHRLAKVGVEDLLLLAEPEGPGVVQGHGAELEVEVPLFSEIDSQGLDSR